MYVFRDLKKLKELEKLDYKETLGGYTKMLKGDRTFAFIEILKDASVKKYREENGHLKGYNVSAEDVSDLIRKRLVEYVED